MREKMAKLETIEELLTPSRSKLKFFLLFAAFSYVFMIMGGKGEYLTLGPMHFLAKDHFLSVSYAIGAATFTYHFPEAEFLSAFIPAFGIALLLIYVASCLAVQYNLTGIAQSAVYRIPATKHWRLALSAVAVLFSPGIIQYFLYDVLQYVHYPTFYMISADPITKYNTLLVAALSYTGYLYLLFHSAKAAIKQRPLRIVAVLSAILLAANLLASIVFMGNGAPNEENCDRNAAYNYGLVAVGSYSCGSSPMMGYGYAKYFMNVYGHWVLLHKVETFVT